MSRRNRENWALDESDVPYGPSRPMVGVGASAAGADDHEVGAP